MPPLSHMALRLELLDLGEKLGWPRMGVLRAGQGNWESLARSKAWRPQFLRAAKIRVENLAGEPEDDLARTVLFGDVLKGLAQEVDAVKAEKAAKIAADPDDREDPKPWLLPDYIPEPEWPELPPIKEEEPVMVKPPRYTAAMRRANLAKAREARKAKAGKV